MIEAIVVIQNREEQRHGPGARLELGGDASVIPLPGAPPLLACIELSDGQVFLDAAAGANLRVNGARLGAGDARLLQAGDLIELPGGGATIECRGGGAELRLRVVADAPPAPTVEASGETTPEAPIIKPERVRRAVAKTPPAALLAGGARRWRIPIVVLAIALPFVALGILSLLAVPVEIRIEPPPDSWRASNSLLRLNFGGRVLLLPGAHRLRAEREGYHPLDLEYRVSDAEGQRVTLQMQPLPGILEVSSAPVSGRAVFIDGEARGVTPLRGLKLPGGRHRIRVRGDDYQDFETELVIEGLGRVQQLAVQLRPAWAVVHVNTRPPGATVAVDGTERGVTPAALELKAGAHTLRFTRDGFRPVLQSLVAEADTEVTLPDVVLGAAVGRLVVETEPRGARLSVDGLDRGATPLSLDLDPGRHSLQLFTPGYARLEHSVTIESRKTERLKLRLEAMYGEIDLRVAPSGAQVRVGDDEPFVGSRVLRLIALPHPIEISLDGYGAEQLSVTPRPGERRVVSVQLETLRALREARRPQVIETKAGQKLLLLRPGRFSLGSSRREAARRANEALYEVQLTRAYYLGEQEVTNAQYRLFDPSHASGRFASHNLDADEQPVVAVGWEQAAHYCNWLSAQQGLPLAYPPDASGRPQRAAVPNTGYRLPTEAEWVWAARYRGGQRTPAPRYDWGSELPPPAGAGNFADLGAHPTLSNVLRAYRDGFIASAPSSAGVANPLGFFGLAGNVAEWMNDAYATPKAGALLRDPRGPGEGEHHVIRGASWRHWSETQLRSSFRDYGSKPRDDLGFRLARSGD